VVVSLGQQAQERRSRSTAVRGMDRNGKEAVRVSASQARACRQLQLLAPHVCEAAPRIAATADLGRQCKIKFTRKDK